MISDSAASYEVRNERGMTSIYTKHSVQHTLMQFFRILIDHEMLGDFFFKIQYSEFFEMYKKYGLPPPNFSDEFFAAVQIVDPKLKQLVLKVELSRYIFNNFDPSNFLSGLDNFPTFLADRKAPFIDNRMMEKVNPNVSTRINLLINEGFYTSKLEIDILKINSAAINLNRGKTISIIRKK